MPTPHADVLKELDALQRRVDELRGMLRSEVWTGEIPDGKFHVLVCRTDLELIGIVLKDVDEVIPMCLVSPVPDSPPWFAGLLNLGGEMVPVLDLSARMGGTSHEPELADSIVICLVEGKRVGVVVCDVVGVYESCKDDLQQVSERFVATPYLVGVSDFDGAPLLMLSISGLFSFSELPEGLL